MNVARMMLTILNCRPKRRIVPRIQIQPTASGRKAVTPIVKPRDRHRKKKTMTLHRRPIRSKSSDSIRANVPDTSSCVKQNAPSGNDARSDETTFPTPSSFPA